MNSPPDSADGKSFAGVPVWKIRREVRRIGRQITGLITGLFDFSAVHPPADISAARSVAGVPVWKIRREKNRLGRQIKALFLHWPIIGRALRFAYDARRGRSVRVTPGRRPPQDEVAVVLIYQPGGLLPSTLAQLDWMARNQVSAVVVSNIPIAPGDMEKLAEHAEMVIERPNVGYDFGGYREGILRILESRRSPRALYVMNDSMWLPLREDCDAIQKGRAAARDVWGLIVDLDWRQREVDGEAQEHVQSYFYRFSQRLVASPEFRRYWAKMPLFNDKRYVIQQCEIRLTGHFHQLGYSFGGLFNWRDIIAQIMALTDEPLLRRAFQYQRGVRQTEEDLLGPLLDDPALSAMDIRERLAQHITQRRIFASTFAMYPELLLHLGIPFLKKARTTEMVRQRREILKSGLQSRLSPPVQAEIAAWDL